jgi:predicted TIM-barrel fold metal-dependent hydrolase
MSWDCDVTKYLVISGDGHAGPPAHVYRDYLDPGFHASFDAYQDELAATRDTRTDEAFQAAWDEETGDHDLMAAYDSDARNKVLDTEGIAAEVLFPDADVLGSGRAAASPFGSGLGSGQGFDPAQVIAGAKAHNRWLAEFCAKSPERRIGIAVVPITAGVDAAVEEIAAAHALGLKGVLIPTRWFDAPAYHDPMYEPVWATCAELGMVLHTHSGAGPADYGEGPGMIAIYANEAYWWAARPLWVLILGGVFERHPNLKYVIAENGAWWAPDLFWKMDEKWTGGHNTRKFGNVFREGLSMKPSEYLNRNCFLAASTPGVEEMERRHLVGVGNLLWGNDLPHPEGTYPYTRYWVRERFRSVPEAEAVRMLGETAADLYRVDRAALASLVENIGISREEIYGNVPLERVPQGASV